MAGLVVHTAQTDNAVTLAEIKNHLRVDGSDDDNVLGIIKQTVDSWASEYTNRTLCTTTYQLYIDSLYDLETKIYEGMYTAPDIDMPRKNIILPKSPVSSISHVKYYDDDDTATTWATSNYYLDNASEPNRFVLRKGVSYPTGLRTANALEIQYVAGYGGASSVPMQIKSACLTYAAYLFEHRGDMLDGKNLMAPVQATSLLRPFVVNRLSINTYRGIGQYGGIL